MLKEALDYLSKIKDGTDPLVSIGTYSGTYKTGIADSFDIDDLSGLPLSITVQNVVTTKIPVHNDSLRQATEDYKKLVKSGRHYPILPKETIEAKNVYSILY